MDKNKPKNDNVLVNILTRTSNRPLGFNRLYQSVKLQTYQNIRHIVSYDSIVDKGYLDGLDIDLIKVNVLNNTDKDSKNEFGHKYAPYNLYCNDLLDKVNDGWIMFIDDDDNLYNNQFVGEIVKLITDNNDEDVLYVWQMRYPDGKVLPFNNMMDKQEIKISNIGAPCFMFHSKHKNSAKWDSYKGSDFRFLSQLAEVVPKKVFLKKVGVQINNFGDFGYRNDIFFKKKSKLPISFYKSSLWYFIPKYHFQLLGIKVFHKKTYVSYIQKFVKRLKL